MQGKVVIVTGAMGVLGRAVVKRLQADGAEVVAVDTAPQAPVEGAALVLGGVDLTDSTAAKAAYDGAVASLGRLDGLANIAGGFDWQTLEGGGVAVWDAMFAGNVRTAVISCHAALPHLAKGGAIVNVGAVAAAQRAPGGMGPYAASKAGVLKLTESLAAELAPQGVRVNAVVPQIIDTPRNRQDMPEADFASWVTPAEVADVVAFLLSDAAAAVTGAQVNLTRTP